MLKLQYLMKEQVFLIAEREKGERRKIASNANVVQTDLHLPRFSLSLIFSTFR